MPDQSTHRAELLKSARDITQKALDEGRELSVSESDQVAASLGEIRSIDERRVAHEKSQTLLAGLDAMARARGSAGIGGHLAMTGPHAKALADKIIDAIPTHPVTGAKALVTGGTQAVSEILLPEVVITGRPAVSLLDVLPSRVVPPVYSFLRQNNRALAAAPVPAGSAKPVSDVSVAGVENRLRVVATVSSAIDHYLLSDNANLTSFVTDELVYGVRVALENEVINGDGTGEHFRGILNTSGIVLQAFVTDALTSIRTAIATLDANGYEAGVIVLSSTDWMKVELLLASSGATDVRGIPADLIARRLWGSPVVTNNMMPAKFGLVIGENAVTVDTDGRLETKWTDATNDDILKNQVRCRVEGRWGVSVSQPAAVVKVGTAA